MFSIDPDEDVVFLIEQKKAGKHKCLNGRFVEYISDKCCNDLEKRIEDAIHSRDYENSRTDARIYYNGVLSVLRRKLREVNKELTRRALSESPVSVQRLRRPKYDVSIDQRILKLSGIL